MIVRVCGRTDQHNYYPESWRKADTTKKGKRSDSLCTVKRTKYMARRIAEVHAVIAQGLSQHVYLLTHTTSPEWNGLPYGHHGPAEDSVIHLRRKSFRLLLDNIRKLEGYRGHYWTCEVHEGERGLGSNYGTIHHHLCVRMSAYWDYSSIAQRWSKLYCGSPNGLDFSPPVKGRKAYHYLVGAFNYMQKMNEDLTLPFRWWGTSTIPRKWHQDISETFLFTPAFNPDKPYKARCARVSKADALSGSARIAIDREMRKRYGK